MATLITGCGGFIGHFLAEHLSRTGVKEVHSLGRKPVSFAGIQHHLCDMSDEEKLTATVQKIQPSQVYHLAGLARVSSTIGVPEYYKANTLPTHCLMNALSTLKNPVKVFYSSSVHVYGNQKTLVNESFPLAPETEYGFSKFLAEAMIENSVENHPHLSAIVARLYTCIGPSQPEGFAASDFCRKLIKLRETNEKVIQVGPVKARRQFIDVRDAVTLFPKLMNHTNKNRFETFNLSSSETHSVEDILKTIIQISKLNVKIESHDDHNNQLMGLQVSTDKLYSIVPRTHFRPMEQTLKDMFDFLAQQ